MPIKPRGPCRWPRCPSRADIKGYCLEHHRAKQRERHRQTDRERPSASKRGYGRQWRRLRAFYLRRHLVCECKGYKGCDHRPGQCPYPSEQVDHIEGIEAGNGWANLQALCTSCHSRKTVSEDRRWG